MISASPSLHYLRYNVLLEAPALRELGFDKETEHLGALRNAFSGRQRESLYAIGCAAGRNQVTPDHFPAHFDLPRATRA